MKYRLCLFMLIAIWCSTCLKPDLEELAFFSVETSFIRNIDGAFFESITMEGRVLDLPAEEDLEDYGFIFSEDSIAVANAGNDVTDFNIRFGAGSPDIFKHDAIIEESKDYYVKAFAQQGERLMTGELLRFSIDLDLIVEITDRINDTLFFRTNLCDGLSAGNLNIASFGVQVSKDSVFPDGATTIYPVDPDDCANQVHPASFNTTYYFRPFAVGQDTTHGAVKMYRVTDGWAPIASLPFTDGLNNAVAVSHNDTVAYLSGGCKNIGNFNLCQPNQINNTTYRFTNNVIDGNGQWDPLPGSNPYRSSEAISISYQNIAWFGMGQVGGGSFNFMVNLADLNQDQDGNPMNFYNGIAFVKNDAIYMGTGISEENEFWRITIQDNVFQIESMPPMPSRANGIDAPALERQGAVVLEVSGRTFVGFGQRGASQLNDVYEFIPPEEMNGPAWQFHSFATEIGPREEAVSFSIDQRAFVGLGFSNSQGGHNDLWEFVPDNPNGNYWQQREPLPSLGRRSSMAFSLNGYGYITGGIVSIFGAVSDNYALSETWCYTPEND